MKKQTKHQPFYRKKLFLWSSGAVAGIIIITLLAFKLSPWPGAMVIRYVFGQDATKATTALQKHQPAVAVDAITNQQYRSNDPDAFLDVYFPATAKDTTAKLPVVIWTHGGAWISGSKNNYATYYKLLAAEGFVVISVGYSLGPEKTYPTAVHQLNDAYTYVQANADRLHADTSKIVLAGDSAGSQLSSQMAALITNPGYASGVGIAPKLTPAQLKGVVLNCGIYKMEELIHPDPTLPKIVGWGDDVSVWAYLGTRDFTAAATLSQMSAYYHVTKAFPATYITGGNGDPLTKVQSMPLADKLESLGVKVTRLFYEDSHQPSLPHEYQFNLDTEDGKKALDATVSFVKSVTR
ncbi:MAG TPA: alpha/beta hydrolase [Candidatus Saccharimonadales bacterium]|nr:alpha/beta hydrolase [Candidatus Saccharimonadales bacterium]